MTWSVSLGPNTPLSGPANDRHPMAEALEWVARIFAVSLIMVVPGVAGQWLDRKLGTNFFVLAGFAFGLTFGLWYLLTITSGVNSHPKKSSDQDPPKTNNQDDDAL